MYVYVCLCAVLDRVKNFLPLIEKANKELEETIRQQGSSAVQIDADMLQPAPSSAEAGGEGEEKEGAGGDGEVRRLSSLCIINTLREAPS